MGIGTLRRYHGTIDPERADAARQDDADPNHDSDPRVAEHLEFIQEATDALTAAREASDAAVAAANAAPDDIDLAAAAEAASKVAQDAQTALEDRQREWDEKVAEEDAREASKHGDLYQPTRGASTADWVAYDDANPSGPKVEREPTTGLRDRIAEFYLGPKA